MLGVQSLLGCQQAAGWSVSGLWAGSGQAVWAAPQVRSHWGSHTGCGLWERQTSRQHTHILLLYYSLTTHILLVYCSYNCMLLMYYSCNTFHILSIYYSYSANTSSAHMLIIYNSYTPLINTTHILLTSLPPLLPQNAPLSYYLIQKDNKKKLVNELS